MRGVKTVIHLAASMRDQPRALDRGAERRRHACGCVRAAERAGASGSSSSPRSARACTQPLALLPRQGARRAGRRASRTSPSTVFAPSIVYSPADPLDHAASSALSLLPAVPVSGSGRARYQPIWAERRGRLRDGRAGAAPATAHAPLRARRARRRSPTTTSCARSLGCAGDGGARCTCRSRSCARGSGRPAGWPATRRSPPGTRRS